MYFANVVCTKNNAFVCLKSGKYYIMFLCNALCGKLLCQLRVQIEIFLYCYCLASKQGNLIKLFRYFMFMPDFFLHKDVDSLLNITMSLLLGEKLI